MRSQPQTCDVCAARLPPNAPGEPCPAFLVRIGRQRSIPGVALAGQKRTADAGTVPGTKQREAKFPAIAEVRPKEALQSLMELHDSTDRPEQAAEWKQKLEEFDHAVARRQAPSSQQ
jgi:hypothetical protein